MKHHSLLLSLVYISFNLAIPPQNAVDRRLLYACQTKNEFEIAQACCLGASKEITDEQSRSLSEIITEHAPHRSIDLADMARFSEYALSEYPRILINRFEVIDMGNMPTYSYNALVNELKLGMVNDINYHEDTIVHRAIRNGQACDHLVKKMIGLRGWFNGSCKLINMQNLDGDTPLHLVIKSSQDIRDNESRRRMCLFLVSRGADAAIKNKKGETPITFDPSFWLTLCSSGIQSTASESFYSKISRMLFYRKKAY
jgi:ankyrin repeat protein